jgi:hypothetical protein
VETRRAGSTHKIDPCADVQTAARTDHHHMNFSDYLIDSALVLLVLMQIKERKLTRKTLVRPLVILGIAVANYLHGIPTSGNDLVLVAALGIVGALIGISSGATVLMRRGSDGDVLVRSGWTSAFFWVLGMGSRFAFAYWISHGGIHAVSTFSASHSITSGEAWTVALLAMAAFEVMGRTLVIAARGRQLAGVSRPSLVLSAE